MMNSTSSLVIADAFAPRLQVRAVALSLAEGLLNKRFCRTPVSTDTPNCLTAHRTHLAALSGCSCTVLFQGNAPSRKHPFPSSCLPVINLAPPLPFCPFSCTPLHQPPATEPHPPPAPSPTLPARGRHTTAPTLHLVTLLTARGVLDSLWVLACTTSSSRRV